jgi:hypothetical protein
MWTRLERRPRHQPPVRHDQGGQTLIEFALTMPLLVALLVGIALLAWVGFCYVSVASAARMGVRHMLTYPWEPDSDRFADADAEITFVVTSTMPLLDWRRAQITIEPEPPGARRVGEDMSVRVAYPLNLPTIRIPYVLTAGSFDLLPPITLQATSRMRLD